VDSPVDFDVIELDRDTHRVVLHGRLDAAAAERLDLKFTAAVGAAGRHAMIDLGAVEFIGSLGLRMFISVARVLQRRGRRMVIFGARPAVLDVLETVALDELIPVVPTEAEARARLAV